MKLKCPFCGYEWTPRTLSPVSCPACKRYFTKKKQPERLETQEVQLRPVPKTLRCEYCEKPAKYHIRGRNVCKDHILLALESSEVQESEIDLSLIHI